MLIKMVVEYLICNVIIKRVTAQVTLVASLARLSSTVLFGKYASCACTISFSEPEATSMELAISTLYNPSWMDDHDSSGH